MDILFERASEKLIECIKDLDNKEKRRETIKKMVEIAKELDLIYCLGTEGFQKENKEVSESLYTIEKKIFSEIEEKEVLLAEGKKILEEAEKNEDVCIEDILEYSAMLSRYSKCPLLWTEENALKESFPAFPTEEIVQQSILRDQEKSNIPAPEAEESSPIKEEPSSQEKGFDFEF
ncbi:hypothetical protein NEFER03_1745 [Nematocida sp. LUAm3]|nr:hypothetical protein NEFER03_1745 [Nematocida sp. LUAm3]KAI5175735.1 hypothetical protein NEFER02_1622 [Nematocida sp. LUAm2]KAI5178641.1 hypothetical protein NEFER01_1777 [Nematocida sp. LUAm1]